jgi:hypothetical protein
MLDDNDGYNNGISHYIECREGYDRLLDIEKMGGKKSIKERFLPAKGQPFFLKGGSIDNPKYAYCGPDTIPFSEMLDLILKYMYCNALGPDGPRLVFFLRNGNYSVCRVDS